MLEIKNQNERKLLIDLPKKVAEIEEKSDNLHGDGLKIIVPSNIIDICTKLETLLGLELSGHTDTLTKASNLIDEIYKRAEIQNEQQHRNAIDKISTHWREIASKLIDQIALKTQPKIEEHMLIVTYKPFHEEYQSKPLQHNDKEYKIAVTF